MCVLLKNNFFPLFCDFSRCSFLLLQRFPSVFHQQTDGGGSCVKFGHFVLLNNFPEPADMRVHRNTFKLEVTYTHTHTQKPLGGRGPPQSALQNLQICKK